MTIHSTFRLMRRVRVPLLVGATALLVSCASIIHGTQQDVGISSTPTGAQVTIDGAVGGTTPFVAKLRRKENHIVRMELAGYQPYETTVTHSVSGWVWGNVVFGGLIGLAVDAISGGLYQLTPEQLSATLLAKSASLARTPDGLYVAVVLTPEPGWQKVGQLQHE